MNSLFLKRLWFYGILLVALGIIGSIVLPPELWGEGVGRHRARRASCQSNLKQIGLAFRLYAQDYDDRLPQRHWVKSLSAYIISEGVFQCPETNAALKTSDYFWNAHFFGGQLSHIKMPSTLILTGDGRAEAPLDASLTQLPPSWLKDDDSPAWRHLGKANYAFADGHVKAIHSRNVSRDLRFINK